MIRRPSKRQISVISAMMDEIARLNKVRDWQHKVIQSLKTVLTPETHLQPLKDLRDKTYQLERYMLEDTDEKIQEQSEIFQSNLEQGDRLLQMVNESTEITKDDHSRAIFVFTVVTVIFLPLSFVAAYLSMNGGPSEDSWRETQALFWQIATPLAVGVGVFCLAVALQGYRQAVGKWIMRHVPLLALLGLGLGSRSRSRSSQAGSKRSDSVAGYSSDRSVSVSARHRSRGRDRATRRRSRR